MSSEWKTVRSANSQVNAATLMRSSEVQYREGGERVFVGKVCRVVSDEK